MPALVFDGGIVVVIGGAGFIGSAVVDALLERKCRVLIVDNLSTGRLQNVGPALETGAAAFVYGDVVKGASGVRETLDRVAQGGSLTVVACTDLGPCIDVVAPCRFPVVGLVGPDDVRSFRDGDPVVHLVQSPHVIGPRMSVSSPLAQMVRDALGRALQITPSSTDLVELTFSSDVALALADLALEAATDVSIRVRVSSVKLAYGRLIELIRDVWGQRSAVKPSDVLSTRLRLGICHALRSYEAAVWEASA